jgi:hypothetical protein
MKKISLHKVKMNAIETALNGVVNKHTIFVFTQINDRVSAEYTGGKIEKEFLVGKIDHGKLNFSYCQLQTDDTLDNGISSCELSISKE